MGTVVAEQCEMLRQQMHAMNDIAPIPSDIAHDEE
jgi:hypothetical protein